MKFARTVFIVAGVWGIVVLTPLFFLHDVTGRPYLPPTSYPHFFYGFLAVTMVWQIAFLIIGSNPVRYRPLMIACVLEKLGYLITVAVLHNLGQISSTEAMTAAPDLLLCILFVAAFIKTGS